MEIKIGRIGRILAGDDVEKYVKIVDDFENTGGFLVLTASDFQMSECFDDWVENGDVLRKYFEASRWVVQWF
jgi:hypothetical protein